MAPGRFVFLFAALSVAPLVALASASCTAVDEQSKPDGGTCIGPSCGPSDAGFEQSVIDVQQPDVTSDAGPPLSNPLCGAQLCLPDDPSACGSSSPSADGSPGAPGADGAAGSDANGPAEAGSDGGTATPDYGCGVVRSASGGPEADCVPSGTGGAGAPCVSSMDCAAGLACVGEGNTAQCRPYCCGEGNTCDKGAFCAERPLKEELASATPLLVPVCVPADDCNLSEPYPCPTGKQCKCKDGTACMVVKDDKTTSCVPPGEGRIGDPCPCAPGHVCSKSTSTCLKVCSTNVATPDCGSGKCQSVAYLPEGFGVCGLGSMGDAG